MGLKNLFVAYYEQPDDLKAWLARLAAMQAESIRLLAEIGCDGVMGYDDWGLQDRLMVSPRLIEQFFMPHYRENWALAHSLGMDVWLHSCGYIIDILPNAQRGWVERDSAGPAGKHGAGEPGREGGRPVGLLVPGGYPADDDSRDSRGWSARM